MNFPDEFDPDFESDIDTDLIFFEAWWGPKQFNVLIKNCDDTDPSVRYRCLVFKNDIAAAVFSIDTTPTQLYEVNPVLDDNDYLLILPFIARYQYIYKKYTDREYDTQLLNRALKARTIE